MSQVLKTYMFVFLYLVAMLKPIAPFIEYAINYDYISNVLCINKGNQEINCNGKCYVMKQLEKQKTEDSKTLRILEKDYPIGFVYIFSLKKINFIESVKNKPNFFQKKYNFNWVKLDYHPPQLS